MTTLDERRLVEIINESLDNAELHWRNGGYKLALEECNIRKSNREDMAYDSVDSNIPGHENVSDFETIIDDFIAIVVDMRGSSSHLNACNGVVIESGIQRVFYETSALLPALDFTISSYNGRVTEYLGDGVLGFIQVADKIDSSKAIYSSYNASKACLNKTLPLVNNELFRRYKLEPLQIGIGMSLSKALVTLLGVKGNKHPKAYGRCVFKATKLSDGHNKIIIDENLKAEWPSSKNGKISFLKRNGRYDNLNGYIIQKSQ